MIIIATSVCLNLTTSVELHFDVVGVASALSFSKISKVIPDPLLLRIARAGRLHVLCIARVLNHGLFFVVASIAASLIRAIDNAEKVCRCLLLIGVLGCGLSAELGHGEDSLTLTRHRDKILLIVKVEQLSVLLVADRNKNELNGYFNFD